MNVSDKKTLLYSLCAPGRDAKNCLGAPSFIYRAGAPAASFV